MNGLTEGRGTSFIVPTPHHTSCRTHGKAGHKEVLYVLGLPHPYMTSGLYKYVDVLLPQMHGP